MQVKFKVLIPFLIQFQKNLKHFIVLQLNLCKGKRPLVPILSVVTDGGFWVCVHAALPAVCQSEASEWGIHGFCPSVETSLSNAVR